METAVILFFVLKNGDSEKPAAFLFRIAMGFLYFLFYDKKHFVIG